MTIRAATESDHDTLRELWTASQDEIGGPDFLRETWGEAWGDLGRHLADGLAFVAVDDDTILGFVFATVPRETPDLGHVTDLYVHPQERRRGVARALMARIVEALQERGVAYVGLDVRVDNVGARALYDRLGFVEEERFLATSAATVLERIAGTEEEERPSFGSTHVQTDDESSVKRAVERFLPRLGRSERTEVTPARNGWITVYDELSDRDREAHRRFAAELSERLGVPSVALRLEQMTVVRYYLFERGRMVDEYLSVPTYFGQVAKVDELSLAANPTLVARLTHAEPAEVRAHVRTAGSPEELPAGPELLDQVAAVLGLETTIER
jgi:ribosomal protein S18 acetylase RimI-like enzyme